ncbi:hypothetical protein [Bosea minatitlanensis]|uniref:Motility protein YjfB-like n=1 Tax=Bosea minatitlanensis TaxID=128782 RepID=A0ABW0F795_9HYPH|nr:hypothetical protein [Bosea minatitlanensis]MCT4494795.1 hypothetical protein [Bosea minatitlanensis]
MSDAAALAQSLAAMQAASTQQALSLAMLRQSAAADRGVVALLEQGAEQAKAVLPAGQGQQVDRIA